jgi:hypothetical protein
MTSAPQLQLMKHALRGQVCIECPAPFHVPLQPLTLAATCEDACPLFINLPRLARVVDAGEPPCGYEIFAKSLQPFPNGGPGPDVVRALTVLESAAFTTKADHARIDDCKTMTRITTELACLDKPAEPNEERG